MKDPEPLTRRLFFRPRSTPLFTLLLASLALWILPLPLHADDYLYRAEVRGTLVSVTPPALVREGRLFVPLEFVQHVLGGSVLPTSNPTQRELRFFDRWVRFTLEQPEMHSATGPWSLPAAPFAIRDTLYVPAELLEEGLGLPLSLTMDSSGNALVHIEASGGEVRNLHLEEQPDRLRLTILLSAESAYQWHSSGDHLEISLPLPEGASQQHGVVLEGFRNPHLREVSRSLAEGFTRVQIGVQDTGKPLISALSNPPRLVLDLPLTAKPAMPPTPATTASPAPPTTRPTPAPARAGPTWQKRNFSTPRGPLDVYVLQISPSDPHWRVRPALAADTLHVRHSVAYICRQAGAVAGLNGGFFAAQGPPVGLLVVDGEWISSPLLNRTILAASASGQVRLGRWTFSGRAHFEGRGFLQVSAVNRNHTQPDEVVIYTRRWASSLPGDSRSTRLAVSQQGMVVIKETYGRPVEIPEGGYVMCARGRQAQALERIQLGETVRLELGTNPAWPELWWALEGGPRLLVDGEVRITSSEEGFRADVSSSCASRSAAGITKSGDLLLVAVESPGTERGGVTLQELAGIMRKLGARQAINLDGGGSTTVVQDGRTINRVRSGPRLVSNALIVVPKPQIAPATPNGPQPASPSHTQPEPGGPPASLHEAMSAD